MSDETSNSPKRELPKFPQPSDYEERIHQMWQDEKCFEIKPGNSPIFTILMPPPNVTSQLHMGHGSGYTIQDWLVRWRRMKDGQAAWIPGLDHAGIATQMMVEKQLAREGLSKWDLGRDRFVKRAEEWKDKYGHKILDQFKTMGFSCDFSRLAYTLDAQRSKGVRYAFHTLFQEGLIYRGQRLVNWDPALQTALGDDEVEKKEISGTLHHLIYPLEEGSQSIVVATTRPETLFGDVAVAVHPDDEHYQNLIGKHVILPLSGRKIPIIADSYVKKDFGTGALKITPAHDENDYLIGQKHQLDMLTVLDDHARLAGDVPPDFHGLDRFEARKKVVIALKEQGHYKGNSSHRYTVPHSSRSGSVIEPKLCAQWFVKMKDLATGAAQAARDGQIQFYPASWQKTWLYWLDNIRDWCISRQLWWGHRIPVWTCQNPDCGHVFSALEDPDKCELCGSKVVQDEDVLDTWFSSWLWPLSPFGWPDSTTNLNHFYPSHVLITGPDIIFQWVARMTMAGLKFHGKLPFDKVLLTAMVCDKQGRKFSKTLGNGIDPLDVARDYGADALRFTAVFIAPQGGRIKMEMSDFQIGRNFIQKIWQATRYILSVTDKRSIAPLPKLGQMLVWQQGLLHELALAAQKVDQQLSEFSTHEAVRTLYHYCWNALCDWAIEACKLTLKENDSDDACLSVMLYAHESALRLLHPLIPFVTEELWQHLPQHPDLPRAKALCLSSFPQDLPLYPESHSQWLLIQQICQKIRGLKQNYDLPRKIHGSLEVSLKWHSQAGFLSPEEIQLICGLSHVKILSSLTHDESLPPQSLIDGSLDFEVAIAVGDHLELMDKLGNDDEKSSKITKFTDHLEKDLKAHEKFLVSASKKLSSPGFLERADPEIIKNTQIHKDKLAEKVSALKKTLDSFSAN